MISPEQDRDTHNPPGPDPDTHIASFIVQHRDCAIDTLSTSIARHADLELALPGATRSIVICESADRRAVMQRVEELQALPGVLNVLLVYHHAEPAQALAEPLAESSVTCANGAPP
jgi:nitrate reductase NapD